MIEVGQKIPSVKVKQVTPDGATDVGADELVAGKKVALVTMPGAFTPSCSKNHLPGYVARAGELGAKGVEVVIVTVNDPHVVRAWAEQHGAFGKLTMVADGNGELTRALGLAWDGTTFGMGPVRAKRAALDVDGGVVRSVSVEEKNADVTASGAEACVARW